MAFDFTATKQTFQRLLRYDWQQSQSRGWTRVSQQSVASDDVTLMGQANKHFAYHFKQGTSPVLGKTFIIDPEETANYGEYKSPASAAFVKAHGQVAAKHHSPESAASALALHAFMQKIYVDTGAQKIWGDWSLGFNQREFNIYKQPKDARESAALKHIHWLLESDAARTGEPSGLDINFRTADSQVNRLKIGDRAVVRNALARIESKIAQTVGMCLQASPQSLASLETTLRRAQQGPGSAAGKPSR